MVMRDKFVIYLHPGDLTHPSWVILTHDGTISNSSLQDDPDGLLEIAEDKEVIVLVPAVDVLLIEVDLPKMGRARLLEALPFAIEDQIISDVESMHIAPGNSPIEGTTPVAICAHEKMREWLQLLGTWEIKADAFVPTQFALPYGENFWSVVVMEETFMMRMGQFIGLGNDHHNQGLLLQLALKEAKTLPEIIYIYNTTNVPICSSLNTNITLKEEMGDPKALIEVFAKSLEKTRPINLLQGAFAVKQTKAQLNRIKKWTACVALAWGLLLVLYPSVSYFILQKKVREQNIQIAEIYKRNFPESRSLVAPKTRMQEKLQKLSASTSENRLLVLLGHIGKGLNTSTIKLKRFDFRDNELALQLNAQSSLDLSQFTDFLTNVGVNVKQQNTNLIGPRVNTMLVIS
jgi:general secretion pathway protein L